MPLELSLLEAVSQVPGVIHLLDYYELEDVFALVLERPPRSQVCRPSAPFSHCVLITNN